jgi:hypothetical protein
MTDHRITDLGKLLIMQHDLIALPTHNYSKRPAATAWQKLEKPTEALSHWNFGPEATEPTGAWVSTSNWDPCEILIDLDCDPADIPAAQEILGITDPEVYQTSASGKRHLCLRTAYPLDLRSKFSLSYQGRELIGDIRHCGSRAGVMWHGSLAVGKEGGVPRKYEANDTALVFNREHWQQLTEKQTKHLETFLCKQERKPGDCTGQEATLNHLAGLIKNKAKAYEQVVEIDHANDFCFSLGQFLGNCVRRTQGVDPWALSEAVWKIALSELPIKSPSRMEAHKSSFQNGFVEQFEARHKYQEQADRERDALQGFVFNKSDRVRKIEEITVELFQGGVRLVRDDLDSERVQYTFYTLHKSHMVSPATAQLSEDDLCHPEVRSCRLKAANLATTWGVFEAIASKLGLPSSAVLEFLEKNKAILSGWKMWLFAEGANMESSTDVLGDLRYEAYQLEQKFDPAALLASLAALKATPDKLSRVPYYLAPRAGDRLIHKPFICCLKEEAPRELYLCLTDKCWRKVVSEGAESAEAKIQDLGVVTSSEPRPGRKVRCIPLDKLLDGYEPNIAGGSLTLSGEAA